MPDPDTTPSPTAAAVAADEPIITDGPTVSDPGPDPEYVAVKDIFINGVRAYNKGDGVRADAVKKLDLKDFVKKA